MCADKKTFQFIQLGRLVVIFSFWAGLLMPYTSVFGYDKATGAAQKLAVCKNLVEHPRETLFRDLKSANIYFKYSSEYEQAIRCHNKEEECLKENIASQMPSFDRAGYIKNLKDTYEGLPTSVRPDNLMPIFVSRLEKTHRNVLQVERPCDIELPKILTRETARGAEKYNDAITYTISIEFVKDVQPPVAIISRSVFRPNSSEGAYFFSVPASVVIYLDASDDKIKKSIEIFAHQAIRKPITNEMFHR